MNMEVICEMGPPAYRPYPKRKLLLAGKIKHYGPLKTKLLNKNTLYVLELVVATPVF